MGRIPLSQLEKAQELPYRIGSRKHNRIHGPWFYRNGDSHGHNGINLFTIIDRIIENNVGKPFDHAFHKFCQIVPKYQQKFFLEQFDRSRFFYWEYFITDDDGIIQKINTREKKKTYRFTSFDYKTECRHILTGKPKQKFYWWEKDKNNDTMYQDVVVSGFEEYFETKKDRRFRRLNAEKMKLVKKRNKQYKITNRNLIDERKFREVLNAKKLKERAEDLVKIQSHGFDPLTSFRKEKLN